MSDDGASKFKSEEASSNSEVAIVGVVGGVALSLMVMVIGALFALDSGSTAGALIAVLAGPALLILVAVLRGRRDFALGSLIAVAFVLVVFGGCIASCSGTFRQMGS